MRKLQLLERNLLKIAFLFFCCTLPHFVWAQSKIYNDSTARKVVTAECDGIMFTKTEMLPSVKNGNKALADSLINYLNGQNISIKGNATFGFLITKDGALVGIQKLSGQLSDEAAFKEALMFYSGLWLPASQNKRVVCAVAQLEIKFKKEKLLLNITQ